MMRRSDQMSLPPAGGSTPSVCVAICTCDRPEGLRRALQSIANQTIEASFSVIVVDNGLRPSLDGVAGFLARLDLHYERVGEPGLTAVRNRALALARATGVRYLACLDDDEEATPDWLAQHVATAEATGVDFQTGPVEPVYAVDPPWRILRERLFCGDGTVPSTSNLLIRLASLPADEADWFRPAYAATGGEDHEFLSRCMANGARHGTASQAIVRDLVPADRLTLRYILRRGLRDGVYLGVRAR